MNKLTASLFGFVSLFTGSFLFADEAEAPARQGSYIQTLIMIGVFLVIFYFVLWRPERRRKKRMEEQRSSIKVGDRVTAMGIIGVVAEIKENTLVLKMVDGSKIEFLKAAISDVQSEPSKVQA